MRKEIKISEFLSNILLNDFDNKERLHTYFFNYHSEDINLDYDLVFLDKTRDITNSIDKAIYVLVEIC